jgi:hypothetical protein
MTLPIAEVSTFPFCGACGNMVTNPASSVGDIGTDLYCDACGADLIAFGFVVATGATPGSPGVLTPATSVVPYDLAGLQATGALGETTAWTVGQYVVLGDGSHAHWDGAAWDAGDAPA